MYKAAFQINKMCICCRLLDVVSGRRTHRELHLNLIFEHIDQDLAQYLEKCPAAGLGPERIQVHAYFSSWQSDYW